MSLLSSALKSEIVHRLAELVAVNYVFPDVAARIRDHLLHNLQAGEYADLDTPDLFALALTMHLQEANRDQHLWVRYHPEALPDGDDRLSQDPVWQAARRQEASRDHYGFRPVAYLPGNVACLEIRYFHRLEWSAAAVHAAMDRVSRADALIIDLRACEGGFPETILLASSYLFAEQPVHLSSIYWRDENVTRELWTQRDLPGSRFVEKPVYILISRYTFSGGEGFAYDLQAQKRAVLVGERTGGGAHPGRSFRLHPNFEAFIAIGRTINPLTGTDWDVTGVVPDVAVPADQALHTAQNLAAVRPAVSPG